ncbi:hypothetical protein DERF_004160 [Dermatophagoides farinae]|uniref:Uncharacterized protein n=1 Tax=Dermatophagoides farinae TaxID=6954 RepID=A0A922LC45_DERFA|nr:hypothetical protein DERF_004160 [Dermatophagoides farinae]
MEPKNKEFFFFDNQQHRKKFRRRRYRIFKDLFKQTPFVLLLINHNEKKIETETENESKKLLNSPTTTTAKWNAIKLAGYQHHQRNWRQFVAIN